MALLGFLVFLRQFYKNSCRALISEKRDLAPVQTGSRNLVDEFYAALLQALHPVADVVDFKRKVVDALAAFLKQASHLGISRGRTE